MPDTLHPTDLMGIIADQQRRIERLERQSGVGASTIISDLAGTNRVGIGQLDAIFPGAGYQPNTFGMRVQDQNGSAVLDTVGLQQVMKSIAAVSLPSAQPAQSFTATDTDYPATTASFTLNRAGSVLILMNSSFYVSGGTANYGYLKGALKDGGGSVLSTTSTAVAVNDPANSFGALGSYILASLGAGTYSANFQYRLYSGGSGTTLTIYSAQFDVFQLGG